MVLMLLINATGIDNSVDYDKSDSNNEKYDNACKDNYVYVRNHEKYCCDGSNGNKWRC